MIRYNIKTYSTVSLSYFPEKHIAGVIYHTRYNSFKPNQRPILNRVFD